MSKSDRVVRPCVPDDEVALSLLGQATFLEAFADVLPGADILAHCTKQHSVEKYAQYLADVDTTVWIADVQPGGAAVGYLVLTKPDLPLEDLDARDVEIKRVYVLHRFQGAGLGARLMNEAETYARAHGFRRLLLGVYGRNEAAISFYRKLGYRQVGTRRFTIGANAHDDLVMGLDLA